MLHVTPTRLDGDEPAVFNQNFGRAYRGTAFAARDDSTIQHLERLNSYGVTFHSYTEPHLCADNEMVRGILLALLATMAKQEAKRLSERVSARVTTAPQVRRLPLRLGAELNSDAPACPPATTGTNTFRERHS